MTKLIRRHSYIRIEEDEEVWIFEDELPAGEAATQIESQPETDVAPEATPRASKAKRILVFVVTTALAVATSLVASLIYGAFTN